MKTVIALKEGFHNGAMVHVNTVFLVADNLTGKWFKPYDGEEIPKPAPVQEEPIALSEFNKARRPRGPLDPKPAPVQAKPTKTEGKTSDQDVI